MKVRRLALEMAVPATLSQGFDDCGLEVSSLYTMFPTTAVMIPTLRNQLK
jgi:hypothetical protein